MLDFILLSLLFSLFLYVLLGGGDFGAGILELFHAQSEKKKAIISKAMGPIWEANHVWLILAIVILFTAFPIVYTNLTTYLHIPLLILLLGIVVRGCAFTFRSYDTLSDKPQSYYSVSFVISSIISSFFIGVIVGSITMGMPEKTGEITYYTLFIKPWFNLFCLFTGLFFCSLFSLIAATYLVGETTEAELKSFFIRRVYYATGAVILTGIFALSLGEYDERVQLFRNFFQNQFCIISSVLFVLLFPLLWSVLKKNKIYLSRFILAFQVLLLMLNWVITQYPFLYKPNEIYEAAAPQVTLQYLCVSLIFGLLIILPAFFYLVYLFKIKNSTTY